MADRFHSLGIQSCDLTKPNYSAEELSQMSTMEQLTVANRIRNQQMLQTLGLNAITPKQQNAKDKKSRKKTNEDANWTPDMAAEEDSDNVETHVRKKYCATGRKSNKPFAPAIKPGPSTDNTTISQRSLSLPTVASTPITKSAKRRIGKKIASLASETDKPSSQSNIDINSNGQQNHPSQKNTLSSAMGKTTTATTGPTACVQPFTGFTAEQIEAARQRSIDAQKRKDAIIRLMRAKQLNKDDFTIIESVGCDKCKKDNENICPIHHNSSGHLDYEELDNRPHGYHAMKSLPEGMFVKESPIPGAGRGVFTGQFTTLRKDTIYGPYEGVMICNEWEAHQSGYCWQIYSKRKISHWIDARQVRRSNWLRYINCTATMDQQNVCAYQVGQNIYYRTVVDIGPDTELLVWYGGDYARELGLLNMAFMASINNITINGVDLACWDCHLEFRCRKLLNQHTFCTAHDTVNTNSVAFVGQTRCDTNTAATGQVRVGVAKSGVVAQKSRVAGSACSAISGVAVSPYGTASDANSHEQHDSCVGTDEGFGAPSARIIYAALNTCQVIGGAGESSSDLQSSVDVSRLADVTDDGRRFQCSTCCKRFERRAQLLQHTRIHTGEKPFECSKCCQRFTHNGGLTQHSRIHTGEKPFECTTCGQRFSRKGFLTRHSLIHSGQKPFECTTCGLRFALNSGLTQHRRTHTGEKPFECITCGQRFTQNGGLTKHCLIHTGEKPFECTTCGQRFSLKYDLARHNNIHTGEKHFVCTTCGQRFALNSVLTQHSRTHTGEKPFECITCGQRFTQNSSLSKHSLIHTGEKPFECKTCGRRFSLNGGLTQHSRIHTGEKPFECTTCSQRFTQICHLTRHSLIHTGEKPFVCTTCGQRFTRSNNLAEHRRMHTERP